MSKPPKVIELHAHCRNCHRQKPPHLSMQDWQRTETGLTRRGLQVWCLRCDMEVAHFTPADLERLRRNPPPSDNLEH